MLNSKIAACLGEAARTVTGQIPEIAGASYRMDAALFAAAGIPKDGRVQLKVACRKRDKARQSGHRGQ
jgi:hypothetical protein